MKKIGIVFCGEMNMCPYAAKYIEACEKKTFKYDVILWNRTGDKSDYPYNYKVYEEKSDLYISKWKKIGAFIRFRHFVKKIIEQQKYDKLIILTTLPGILCYRTLTRKYKGRYIFDFRDLSFEKFCIYRKWVKKLCDSSFFACISSPGFEDILGDRNFVIAHNFRYSDIRNKKETATKVTETVNLLHIGITRGEDYNKRLVDLFGNDSRFNIYIVGSGNDTPTLIEYAKPFPNIYVVGTYNNAEKEIYINNADMMLYYYPCDFNCNRALANKYYDGIIYKKPLLGNIETYSGKRLMERKLGISLSLDDVAFADKVYSYITELDVDEFNMRAERELAEVLFEDGHYLRKIDEFLDS